MTDTNEPRAKYTAHDVSDLVSTLPTLFGFIPEESLCVIAANGSPFRLGFRMRVDLPPAQLATSFAEAALGYLTQHGKHPEKGLPDGVILISVSKDMAIETTSAVADYLSDHVRVLEVIVANETHALSLLNPFADPQPYKFIGEAAAVAVSAGQIIRTSRDQLVKDHAPLDNGVAAKVRHRIGQVMGSTDIERVVNGNVPAMVKGLLAKQGTKRMATATLMAEHIPSRDQAWEEITIENATAHYEVWSHVARHAPEGLRAGPYALAAFAAWQMGDGAISMTLADYALADQPGYRMAKLILNILEAGASPWAWGELQAIWNEGEKA